MAVIEFYHLTGHKASNVDANKPIKLIENDDEKVVLYFDEVGSNSVIASVLCERHRTRQTDCLCSERQEDISLISQGYLLM